MLASVIKDGTSAASPHDLMVRSGGSEQQAAGSSADAGLAGLLGAQTTAAMERWDPLHGVAAYADDVPHISDDDDVFAFTGDVFSPIDDEINEINIWRRSAAETHGTRIIPRFQKRFFHRPLLCVLAHETLLSFSAPLSAVLPTAGQLPCRQAAPLSLLLFVLS